MATTSDAGGYLPRWLTNMILPGAISNDVPSVLKYTINDFSHSKETCSIDSRSSC